MTEQLELEIAQDHLESLTAVRKAVHAIEELVWNSLDADASRVEIELERNALDGLSAVRVRDNGSGIDREFKNEAFGSLGGSPKLKGQRTETGRAIHGKEGKGRFRAFALGCDVKWTSRYGMEGVIAEYVISGTSSDLRQFEISEDSLSSADSTGVTVEMTMLHEIADTLLRDSTVDELASRIALYLRAYPGITVVYDGRTIRYEDLQEHVAEYPIGIEIGAETHEATLTVIEWSGAKSERRLYLCNSDGFARHETKPGIKAAGYDFTAYVKADYFDEIEQSDFLLEELDPAIQGIVDAAKGFLRDHFRQREAERASEVVEQWKSDDVYPYLGDPASPVETVERELFDVCALKVHEFLPSFRDSDRKSKKLTFSLIKQALETGPSGLQTIFQEVLALPNEQQEELAALLQKTTLASIIGAASTVTDRLTFLLSLEEMLFSKELKKRVKERSQLHRILVNELWIFGEQYSLGSDDESLKNVLIKHVKLLDREQISADAVVKDLDDKTAIPDLMLYRTYPQPVPSTFEHLVVELKRPNCTIGQIEIGQIEKYAFSVEADERFDKSRTRWTFLLLGTNLDEFAKRKCSESGKKHGHIYATDSVNVHVKTWSEILSEAKWRHEFFREKLSYQATTPEAIAYLKERYAQYIPPMPGKP